MEWKRRSAFVFIKSRPGKEEAVCERINGWDHTIGAFMIHWPWDVLVWFDAENIDETHRWVSEIRSWSEVEWTSTAHVFHGFKRDHWFWEFPACSWVKLRSKNMYETYEDLKNYTWMTTFASVPGDWDCIGLVTGDTWEEVSSRMGQLKEKGYEIECYTTYRWWWNKTWQHNWFPEVSACGTPR